MNKENLEAFIEHNHLISYVVDSDHCLLTISNFEHAYQFMHLVVETVQRNDENAMKFYDKEI